MKSRYEFTHENPHRKKVANKHLMICTVCGNPDVEQFEFGISCELCGSSFYFHDVKDLEVK